MCTILYSRHQWSADLGYQTRHILFSKNRSNLAFILYTIVRQINRLLDKTLINKILIKSHQQQSLVSAFFITEYRSENALFKIDTVLLKTWAEHYTHYTAADNNFMFHTISNNMSTLYVEKSRIRLDIRKRFHIQRTIDLLKHLISAINANTLKNKPDRL